MKLTPALSGTPVQTGALDHFVKYVYFLFHAWQPQDARCVKSTIPSWVSRTVLLPAPV
jgi:hypothetical protein